MESRNDRTELEHLCVGHLYGELTPEEERRLADALAQDESLRAYLEELRQLKQQFDRLELPEPRAAVVDAVLRAAEAACEERQAGWLPVVLRWLLRPHVGLAAAAVVVLALGVYMLQEVPRPALRQGPAEVKQQLVVPRAEERARESELRRGKVREGPAAAAEGAKPAAEPAEAGPPAREQPVPAAAGARAPRAAPTAADADAGAPEVAGGAVVVPAPVVTAAAATGDAPKAEAPAAEEQKPAETAKPAEGAGTRAAVSDASSVELLEKARDDRGKDSRKGAAAPAGKADAGKQGGDAGAVGAETGGGEGAGAGGTGGAGGPGLGGLKETSQTAPKAEEARARAEPETAADDKLKREEEAPVAKEQPAPVPKPEEAPAAPPAQEKAKELAGQDEEARVAEAQYMAEEKKAEEKAEAEKADEGYAAGPAEEDGEKAEAPAKDGARAEKKKAEALDMAAQPRSEQPGTAPAVAQPTETKAVQGGCDEAWAKVLELKAAGKAAAAYAALLDAKGGPCAAAFGDDKKLVEAELLVATGKQEQAAKVLRQIDADSDAGEKAGEMLEDLEK